LFYLQDYGEHGHFTFLLRKFEQTVLDGVSPQPIERVLLTSGLIDYALRSHHQGGVRLETPLDIVYSAPESIPDTGVGHPVPVRPEDSPSLAEEYRLRAIQNYRDGLPRRKS